MGCVFYTMLNAYTPFNVNLSTGDGYEDVTNCNHRPFKEDVSIEGLAISGSLVNLNPEERVDQILLWQKKLSHYTILSSLFSWIHSISILLIILIFLMMFFNLFSFIFFWRKIKGREKKKWEIDPLIIFYFIQALSVEEQRPMTPHWVSTFFISNSVFHPLAGPQWGSKMVRSCYSYNRYFSAIH